MGGTKMARRFVAILFVLSLYALNAPGMAGAQEDKVGEAAINAIKVQVRMGKGVEVKFVEKKESPIPEFYAVKLMVSYPDREVPVMIYVDKTGEKVIMGNLYVKGENVTRKDAGEVKPRKVDLALLEMDKSPARGPAGAKMTVVEFANFQCPFCMKAWMKMKEVLEKNPADTRYVFKFFPVQGQTKSFDLCELAAAAQAVSNDAFWAVHDFLFTEEGQTLAKGDKDGVKQKIDQILKEKGIDVKAFQIALETGKGKKRVEEDIAAGTKIRITGTPATFINGDLVRGPINDKVLGQYLKK
jgi:protein-disulfide isomerase